VGSNPTLSARICSSRCPIAWGSFYFFDQALDPSVDLVADGTEEIDVFSGRIVDQPFLQPVLCRKGGCGDAAEGYDAAELIEAGEVQLLGLLPEISMPASSITSMARGLIEPDGKVPALSALLFAAMAL